MNKLYIVLFCAFIGCGGGLSLTKIDAASKQVYIDSYYSARSSGVAPFNNLGFYEHCDSLFKAEPAANQKQLANIFIVIAEGRAQDSLWDGKNDYPIRKKNYIDDQFKFISPITK